MWAQAKALLRDQPVLREAMLWGASRVRSLRWAPPGIYALCYHRVPRSAQDGFARQIRFLRQHGVFVDADTALALLEDGNAENGRSFLLTFDDGYADTLDVALPVLQAAEVPAILFLVSEWLDEPPAHVGREDGYMNRADVAAWLHAGMAIGSHTASHRRLSQLDAGAAEEELATSRRRLGELTGSPPRHFACPWGVADQDFWVDREPLLAAECGYRTFFTTRRGRAVGQADLLLMPRHVLEPHWGLYQLDALMGGWARAGR